MLPMLQEETQQKTPTKANASRTPTLRVHGNKMLFISLGCPRNLVDTEVMLGILLKAGYEPTEEMDEADHIVINTCGFLQASRDESMTAVQEAIEGRKDGAKVIVTGCMVQTHSDAIKAEHPDVDYFLGSGDVEGILRAVETDEQGEQITSARSYLEAGEIPRQISTPDHYAYLKIAEGCRKRCAYCIIPDIKGPLKSKPAERVLKEFQTLRKEGVKEYILIAQDLGDWGKDLGFRRSEGLIHLLEELMREEGDFWLRLLYLYPDEITDELIAVMKKHPRICAYLDIPIQHVNNTILKSMHRATSREQIVKTITTLRREIPNIVIRTSLIVGFPGETEEQFEELLAFVKEYQLDQVGIFQYSQEPGSRAAELPDQVSQEIKEERYHRLMKAQQEAAAQRNRRWVGKTIRVLVEGYHPESNLLMQGRFQGQAPEIDGIVIINDGRHVTAFGEWYDVEITDVAAYDLVGHVLERT